MAALLLVAAAAAHLGFQATVTLLVYPALGDTTAEVFADAHARHGRRITPLVALVYAALLLGAGWVLLDRPSPAAWTAAVLVAVLLGLTGLRAAPLHGRLGDDREPGRWRSLVAADRVRLVLAVAVLGASLLAARP